MDFASRLIKAGILASKKNSDLFRIPSSFREMQSFLVSKNTKLFTS